MGMIENLKEVVAFAKKLNDAQILKATADLELECADLLSQKAELTQQGAALKEEVAALRQKLSLREELTFEEDAYWKHKEDGSRDGPFCSACVDDKGKTVHMHAHRGKYHEDYYKCPVCRCHALDAHGTPTQSPPIYP